MVTIGLKFTECSYDADILHKEKSVKISKNFIA